MKVKGFGDKGSSYEKEGMVNVKGFGWGQEIKLRGRGMVKVKGFRDKGSSYEEEEWWKWISWAKSDIEGWEEKGGRRIDV